jgi:FkbM family methyltransferase
MNLRKSAFSLIDWLLLKFLESKFFELLLFRISLFKFASAKNLRLERIMFLGFAISNMQFSTSQLAQDSWIIFKTKAKRNGIFVEIGACEPKRLSNTYLLESEFNWSGLLVEPNPMLCSELAKSRSSKVVNAAISAEESVNLTFAKDPEFSRLSVVENKYKHKLFKATGESSTVPGITLAKLFKDNEIPSNFEYLSIDVEGFELEVLKTNDWGNWKPKYITIEHNFNDSRHLIRELLLKHGYSHSPEVSIFSWDDWYFLEVSD